MLRSTIAIFLGLYFFLASTLLPKGDFALMQDLHGMYQQYASIDDPKEVGIIDFVFDYLLNGEAFSNDSYKGHPIPYNTVQFQHSANFMNFVVLTVPRIIPPVQTISYNYHIKNDCTAMCGFSARLLRPPVSC